MNTIDFSFDWRFNLEDSPAFSQSDYDDQAGEMALLIMFKIISPTTL